MSSPRIAIVVPAFNAEAFLAEALESVRAQTVSDWEAIVVDDGSTDATAAIARRQAGQDDRVRVLSKPNGGVSSARNAGFRAVSPSVEYVLFLDADDLLEPTACELLLDGLTRQPGCAAIYGLPRFFDANGIMTGTLADAHGYDRRGYRGGSLVPWPPDRPTTFEVLVLWPVIATPGQVLHRRAALTDPPFDESLRISEDWDAWLRLAASHDLGYLPTFVMLKRCHEQNVSGNGRLMADGERIVRTKWRRLATWTADQRRLLRRAHRDAALLRLTWARAELRHRHLGSALAHTRRFVRAYVSYLDVQYAR